MIDAWKYFHADKIICPYCGHDHQDCDSDVTEEDRPVDWECENCERSFTVSVSYSTSYTSHPIEPGRE